jgi:periplasmic protein TonB
MTRLNFSPALSRHAMGAWALSAGLGLALMVAASAAHADPKILKKVPPEFPDAAVSRRISDGVLKTHLTIDGGGNVTEVVILEALPPPAKIFNAAATAALKQWKFEGNGQPQVAEIRLVFSME